MTDSLVTDLESLQGERKSAQVFLSEHDRRIPSWTDWDDRMEKLDRFLRGDWAYLFPDDSAVMELPKVPNIAQIAIYDYAALASSVQPSLRCQPARESAATRAAKREKIAAHYVEANHLYPLMAVYWFMDLIGAGVNFRVVLPDFDTGLPCIRRYDPRHAYPPHLYSPDRPYKDMLFAYERSKAELANEYPDLGIDVGRRGQEMCKVIEFYDSSEWVRVAKLGNRQEGMVLDRADNLIGRPPVVATAWPSFDGQFRGMFDQVFGVQGAENRITNLLIDLAAEMVGAPLIAYGIENPEDYGTAVLRAKDKDGFMRREGLQIANPQIFNIIQDMRSTARTAAFYPAARSGVVEQSIVSAAGLNTLVGNLATFVAQMQRIEAYALQQTLELCFAVDEKYLSWTRDDKGERIKWRKFVIGSSDSTRFALSYVPADDIRGDYKIKADYPLPGSDQFGAEIRVNSALQNGIISQRRARELSGLVDEVLEMEKEITKENILRAGLAFIQAKAADPNGPDFAPAAALIRALDADEETILTILAQFEQIQNPQAAGPAGPASAFEQASSVARGGLPAPQTNVPGVGSATAGLVPLPESVIGGGEYAA